MKKITSRSLVAILSITVLLTLLVSTTLVLAEYRTSTGSAAVESGEVIDDDLFIAGDTVTISGTVNGDVFAAGANIIVDGIINGDVYAAGGGLTVTGTVTQDVILVGGNLIVHGAAIGDGVVALGGNVQVDSSTDIKGGFIFGAGSVQSAASVGRGMTGGTGILTLSGSVGRDVNIGVGQLVIEESANIAGDVLYNSQQEGRISPIAQIGGVVEKRLPHLPDFNADFTGVMASFRSGFIVWSFFSALLIGLIVLVVVPSYGEVITEQFRKNPWMSLLIGFLAFILTPFAVGIMLVTIIGVPLGLITIIFYMIALYFVKIVAGFVLGHFAARIAKFKRPNRYGAFAVGLFIYVVLTSIPFIGVFFSVAATLFGLGTIMLAEKHYINKLR
jgi:hypothetical protein